MADDAALATRLTELEIHVSHQDQIIDDLSEIVRRQWDDIETLRRSLEKQTALLQEMGEEARDPSHLDQRPPHY